MTSSARPHVASSAVVAREDVRAFWPIFVAAFVVFMAIALVSQVLGVQWRSWLPGAEGVKSVPGGVKAAVYTFMSHLH
jgi:light-harvesting complex 1 beta chain